MQPQQTLSHRPRRPRALIAGGGPAGAAAAVLLARAGLDVVVHERTPARAPVGAGILLHPNGLAVLDGIGIGDAIRAVGHVSRRVRVTGAGGRPIMDRPVPDLGAGHDHLVAVRRSTLAGLLDDAMAAEPAVTIVRNATVTGADHVGELTVAVDGTQTRVRGDLIVAADGIHSTVRDCGDFGVRIGSRVSTYWRALIPGRHLDDMAEWWTPIGLFGGSPVDGDATYVYGTASSPAVADALQRQDVEALAAAWRTTLPIAGALIDRLPSFAPVLVNEARTIHVAHSVRGRTVLIGDAAHAMEPTLGQGANSSFVDAAVLADSVCRHDTVEEALAAHAARRAKPVRRVQVAATRVARLAAPRSARAAARRDLLLRAADGPRSAARRFRSVQQVPPLELREMIGALDRVSA